MLRRSRIRIQGAVKSLCAIYGLEVRYVSHYPQALDPRVLSRWFENDPSKVRTILDVGANVGQSSLYLERQYPNASIHAFEPFPDIFHLLKSAVIGHARISTHLTALSRSAGVVCADYDGDPRSQRNRITAPQPNTPLTEDQTAQRIAVNTVDGFCDAQGITEIDILKTDTEGHDLDVLEGARHLISKGRIRTIVSEVGFYDDHDHTSFDALHRFLRDREFDLVGVYETNYLPDGRCDYCNVVFARNVTSG
jgi:FkbM family methyltransferase